MNNMHDLIIIPLYKLIFKIYLLDQKNKNENNKIVKIIKDLRTSPKHLPLLSPPQFLFNKQFKNYNLFNKNNKILCHMGYYFYNHSTCN